MWRDHAVQDVAAEALYHIHIHCSYLALLLMNLNVASLCAHIGIYYFE